MFKSTAVLKPGYASYERNRAATSQKTKKLNYVLNKKNTNRYCAEDRRLRGYLLAEQAPGGV